MALPSITSGQIAIDPVSGVFFFRNGSGALVSSSLNLLQTSNTLVTTEDSIQIAGNVVISGDLTVNGDTTIIKTEVLTVEDKNIELGNVTSPTNTLADGGGITLKGTTNKTFNWSNSTSSWTSSENIDLASGKVYKINGVEILSANAYAGSSAKWTNARTITLAGDLTGNVSIDGSANVTLTAAVAANSVALGTDTTGDYISSLVAGTGISLSNNSGETATPTITLNAVIDDLTDVTLTTPANGDFFRYNGSVWINDAINLSTDTIGDYVDHLSAGTGITITNNSGEASIPTVSIGQSVATNADVSFNQVTAALVGAVTGNVAGNLTGNVTGNVTGNLTGNVTGNVTGNLTGDVTGTASNSNSWVTSRRITLAGDLSGNVLIKGDADVTLTATVVANAVALGTDTTGDFVANLVAGTGITITDNTGEGMTPVIKVADSYTTNMVSNIANSASSVSAYVDTVGNTAYSNAVTYINNRTLDDLSGVTLSNAATNNVLLYNGSAWINSAFNTAKLSDVLTSNVENNQILIWDSGLGKWVNRILPEQPQGTTLSVARGNGIDQHFSIYHGFNTADVVVTVRSNLTNEVIQATWKTAASVNGVYSEDYVTVSFNEPPTEDEMQIVIYGAIQSTTVNITGRLDNLSGDVMVGSPSSGEALLYNGSKWINRKSNITTDMGDVVISGAASGQFLKWNGSNWINANIPTINTLDDVGDVSAPTPSSGQFLKWNGTNWVNADIPTINTLDDVGDVTITSAANSDFLKYNGSAWVNDPINLGTDTVGGYVTSLVAGTGITLANNSGEGTTPTITVDTSVIQARVANVTDVEIGYLDGVTSAIQTQLNDKSLIASPTFTGTPSAPTAAVNTNTTQIATTAFVINEIADNVYIPVIDNLDDLGDVTASSPSSGDLLKWNGTAWVNASGYALLASPALTGTPTAPTATLATDTTQVATTAFVRAEVAALVNSASSTLDTLGEIATALGNDAALSTTLTSSIALKAPLASPTFTGTVTIPAGASISGFATLASPTFTGTPTLPTGTIATTQTANDSTTAVATTAFVTTADNLKANLASPTFTGTVTLPANTVTSSMIMDGTIANVDISASAAIDYSKLSLSNSIATTDLVSGAARAGFNSTLRTVTSSNTLVISDLAKLIVVNSSSTANITVPADNTVNFNVGDRIDFVTINTGLVTFIAAGGVSVSGTPGLNLRTQYSGATLVKLAANTWVAMGDLKQ